MTLLTRRNTAVCAAAACAAALANPPAAFAVAHGSVAAAGDHPYIVKLVSEHRGCTGVLLPRSRVPGSASTPDSQPNTVLTTRDCLTGDPQPAAHGVPAEPTTVVLGLPAGAPATRRVTHVRYHPTRNVAVATLDSAVAGIPPVSLAGPGSPLQSTTAVAVPGYPSLSS